MPADPPSPPPPPQGGLGLMREPPPKRKLRRSWGQRLTIAVVFVGAFACFVAAGALYAAQRVIEDRNLVPAFDEQQVPANFEPGGDIPTGADEGAAAAEEAPVETFPPAEPEARNFLITGADNNECVDPDSPYAGAFGDRTSLGERSDTIMVWRVNPSTSQVAVLSFPRDLWVTIAGRQSKQRINTAYDRTDPIPLRDTIFENFFVPVDYWIQIDFCAFKTLVDAVDGVAVPFDTPVRDTNTGLNVESAGCYTFDGDHALAYVRSRKLESLQPDGTWEPDGTSDLGRISRQQDFLRRVADALLAQGPFDPSVARALIDTSTDYVSQSADLTPSRQLEFAGVLSGLDPAQITTYQIESRPDTVQGNAVLIPQFSDNMNEILDVFRGRATLAEAPDQVLEPGNSPVVSPPPTEAAPTTPAPTPPSGAPSEETPTTATTPPTVLPEENQFGVVPDDAVTC